MDFELIEKALPILLLGAGVTIEITAVSVFIGFCIGLFVGIARICKVKVLRILAAIYADCIRGTPLLVQIFLNLAHGPDSLLLGRYEVAGRVNRDLSQPLDSGPGDRLNKRQ